MKTRLLLVLGLWAGVASCKPADSVVLVNVTINQDVPPVTSLRVAMSMAGTHDLKSYPEKAGSALPLSTSFVVVLPRSRSGRLDLAVDGVDENNKAVGHGTTQVTIVVGGTATASVVVATGATLCGNGVVDLGESCDDSNQYSFDGCDFRCQSEVPKLDAGPLVDGRGDGPASGAAETAQDLGAAKDLPAIFDTPFDTSFDAPSPVDASADLSGAGGILGTGGSLGTGGITGAGGTGVKDGATSTGGTTNTGGVANNGGSTSTGGTTVVGSGGSGGADAARTGGAGGGGGGSGGSDAAVDVPVIGTGGAGGTGDVDATSDANITDGPALPKGWIDRTPATLPASWPMVRSELSLAYDPGRGKVAMFGGWLGGTNYRLDETWEWDAALGTWTNRSPATLPSSWPLAMVGPALAYDGHGAIFLFGGFASSVAQLNGAWNWNGSAGTWTNLTPVPLPSAWPASRAWSPMAYDSGRDRVALFGGSATGGPTQDLWEWNASAATWTNRSSTASAWPAARTNHALVYDVGRNRVVLFGGSDANGGFLRDTWEWDGASGAWTNRTPSAIPSGWPSARQQHAMAYDPRGGKVVLFGGNLGRSGGLLVDLNDTWEWDGTAGTWKSCTPSPLPSSWPEVRSAHAMSYDGTAVMLFGGGDYVTTRFPSSQTWEWGGCP